MLEPESESEKMFGSAFVFVWVASSLLESLDSCSFFTLTIVFWLSSSSSSLSMLADSSGCICCPFDGIFVSLSLSLLELATERGSCFIIA